MYVFILCKKNDIRSKSRSLPQFPSADNRLPRKNAQSMWSESYLANVDCIVCPLHAQIQEFSPRGWGSGIQAT